MEGKVAVVTNSTERLGLSIVKELCRKFNGKVFLTASSELLCLEAVRKLSQIGLEAEHYVLDMKNRSSVQTFAAFLAVKYGSIDVLVNNNFSESHNEFPSYEDAKSTIESIYTPLKYSQEYLFPLLRYQSRVVNITSCYGHLSNLRDEKWLEKLQNPDLTADEIDDFVEEYLSSIKNGTLKIDLNKDKYLDLKVANIAVTALTFVQQKQYASKNISINAINPGSEDPEEGAKGPLYLIMDASENLKGTFMWSKKLVDWYDFEGDYCKNV